MKYIKLIAKPDTWYKVGTEVFFDDSSVKEVDVPIKRITKDAFEKRSKEWHSGCMVGLHTPTNYHEVAVVGTDDRVDGELCFLEEFDIIETDEYIEFQNSKELEKYYIP
jgi:alpha-acetolactate decarboxylase